VEGEAGKGWKGKEERGREKKGEKAERGGWQDEMGKRKCDRD
jgi:hypothetical protein